MFTDQAQIYVKSGKGGDGAVHFRREKFVAHGGPDGGDGGKGGDVVLEVLQTMNTLSQFRHKMRFCAQDGSRGSKQKMTGRSGEELIINIPPGTLVKDEDSGEILGDLVEPGQRLVVAKGGRGGRGNVRFATSTNQAPRVGERGEPANELNILLELKLIADVGIIGIPNSGKSTLLSVVSNANPKIASYPFSTLTPNLGVADLDEHTTLVLADIPGLIEGAHKGVGLGHDFLRHIQRTRVLIHLLDGMSEDPILDFAQINSELALFDANLVNKPQVVVFNKIDLPDAQKRWTDVAGKLQKLDMVKEDRLFAISAVAGTNVRKLLYCTSNLLKEEKKREKNQVESDTPAKELPVYRFEKDARDFKIYRISNGWRISGEAIERAAAMTYWEHFQSVRRFQRILETLGVDDALQKAGVQAGDTVVIGDHELEWAF